MAMRTTKGVWRAPLNRQQHTKEREKTIQKLEDMEVLRLHVTEISSIRRVVSPACGMDGNCGEPNRQLQIKLYSLSSKNKTYDVSPPAVQGCHEPGESDFSHLSLCAYQCLWPSLRIVRPNEPTGGRGLYFFLDVITSIGQQKCLQMVLEFRWRERSPHGGTETLLLRHHCSLTRVIHPCKVKSVTLVWLWSTSSLFSSRGMSLSDHIHLAR